MLGDRGGTSKYCNGSTICIVAVNKFHGVGLGEFGNKILDDHLV